jgi:hypothetical protein
VVAAALALAAALCISPPAHAGVVTYAATDVPKSADDGGEASSVIQGPGNLPTPIDLDVVGVRLNSSGIGSNTDKLLFLQGPDEFRNAGLLDGGCTTIAFNMNYDDSAPLLFTPPGDCTATGTRKPKYTPLNELLDQGPDTGVGFEGPWKLSLFDTGLPDATGPTTLSAWSLRVTFAPMTFTAEAEKQRLRKKLEVSARCSADCRVATAGDAKVREFGVHAFSTETLAVPLRRKRYRRLRRHGKARIALEASNPLGDRISREVKVKLTR